MCSSFQSPKPRLIPKPSIHPTPQFSRLEFTEDGGSVRPSRLSFIDFPLIYRLFCKFWERGLRGPFYVPSYARLDDQPCRPRGSTPQPYAHPQRVPRDQHR
jgi:hypothetical protein